MKMSSTSILKNNQFIAEKPLVSILVITYNSSKYVLETLESAKNQDYNNIELIISDDCSMDNTFEICRKWLERNKDNFIKVKLVQLKKNSGIAGNCNNGSKYCSGEWVKLIAGDDKLLPHCISSYVNYLNYSNELFFFSFPAIILDHAEEEDRIKKEEAYRSKAEFFEMNAWDQYKYLLINGLPMSASTFFFNSSELKKLGGFDESYMQEDRPLYMKLTKLGYKLGNVPKKLVQYRIHSENISTKNKKDTPVNEYWFGRVHKVVKDHLSFSLLYRAPWEFIEYYNKYLVNSLTLVVGNNYKNYRIFRKLRYLSPIYFKKHRRFVGSKKINQA